MESVKGTKWVLSYDALADDSGADGKGVRVYGNLMS